MTDGLSSNKEPERRLYEIATLAALRDRLRSAEIWIDGSRSFRPIDEHLMPRTTFITLKEEDRLGLGVQPDGAQWLADVRRILDLNFQRLAHRARSGKLEGVCLEAGTLIVTPTGGEIPVTAEELNAEISDMYPLVEVPDLLREVHEWTGFADLFTNVRTGDVPKMSMPYSRAYWRMRPISVRSECRAHPRDQRSPDWVDAHIPCSIEDLPRGASVHHRCAHRHLHSRLWGNGTTSSSDGQFFRASDRAAKRGDINLHYGSESGSIFYSLSAFWLLAVEEGIISALELSHAFAATPKIAPRMPEDTIIVLNLCGWGDKDIFAVSEFFDADAKSVIEPR